jgi:HlyD family secretion protein
MPIKELIKKHATKKRLVSLGLVAVAATGIVGYRDITQTKQPLRYVMAAVTRGTLVTTVTGSGQVSGLNQIDIKPSVSGAITKVLVKQGDTVKAGTPLFNIDNQTAVKAIRDAAQSVSDARLSVQSAQLSLDKLKQPPDSVSLISAQNTLNQAQRDLETLKVGADPLDIQQAENDLNAQLENVKMASDGVTPKVVRDAYDTAVSTVKSVAQTLQQDLYDADSILGVDNPTVSDAFLRVRSVMNSNVLADAKNGYPAAKVAVMSFKSQTDALPLTGANVSDVDSALQNAQTALQSMDPFLRNVYDVLMNSIASASFSQSSLDGLRGTIQSDRTGITSKLTGVLNQMTALDDARTSYTNAQLNVEKARTALDKLKKGATASDIATAEDRVRSAQASLDKLKKGADPIDIATSQNSLYSRYSALTTALNRLADAQTALNDYTVKAPFDGVVAKVDVTETDLASSYQASQSTALATMVTNDKIAQMTLNEVDVTKVQVGQKATLTFDAVPDLTIAGVVSQVDTIGTASQGVVNYSIKVVFSTQDDRIKPGMSVSVAIATNVKSDVLLVPNAAVKTLNGESYVQTIKGANADAATSNQGIASATAPESITVQTDLSNDQSTIITNGVNEGDLVIVRTIDPNVKTTTSVTSRTATGGAASAIRIGGGIGGFAGGRGN